MKISPLLQTMSIPEASASKKSKMNGDRFRQFLDESKLQFSNQKRDSKSIDATEIKSDKKLEKLLEKEINELFTNSSSLHDVLDKTDFLPSAVSILSLVKVIEGIEAKEGAEILSPLISMLNSFLKEEYASYSISEPVKASSMRDGLLQLDTQDQDLLEGELLIGQLITNDSLSIEELEAISQNLTEHLVLNESEEVIRESILNQFMQFAQPTQVNDRLVHFIRQADLQTILSALIKTNGRLIGESSFFSHSLNQFVGEHENMSVDFKKNQDSSHFYELRQTIKELVSKYDHDKLRNFVEKGFAGDGNLHSIEKMFVTKTTNILRNNDVNMDTITIQLEKHFGSTNNLESSNQVRRDFTNQLVKAFETSKFFQLSNGSNRLVIKLNPEHLGSLTVRLIQKNGEMIARIIASSDSAKELLEHSVRQLRHALPSMQIEIDRFDVHAEQPPKSLKDHTPQKEKNDQEFNEDHAEDGQDEGRSFIESLKEVLKTED